jgi:hypothetical protein
MDLVFTVIFLVECIIKVIGYGFVMCEGSYLRESWSKLDFFIVITSLLDASMPDSNLAFVKILRILRPLRFISHNQSMKFVVGALLQSLGGIANVGIVIFAVFLMYAILGVNLFAGKMFSCSINSYVIDTQIKCFKAKGAWSSYFQNMDDVYSAILTLLGVATFEGWPDVAYEFTDATDVGFGPKPGISFTYVYYFMFFVFFVAMFLMNLFVGVIFMNFESV